MNLINKVNIFFDKILNQNCCTNVYGTSRSILAFGSLITFVLSSPEILFDKDLFNANNTGDLVDKLNLFYLLGYVNINIAYIISIIVLLLVLIGIYPRFTGVLHWIVNFSFYNSAAITDGGDQIAMILSFYLIPVTIMDNRKNHFNGIANQTVFQKNISTFILKWVIPLQIAIIYFHAATEKLYKVEEWRNGTALYYILEDPLFGSSLFKDEFTNFLANKYIVVPLTWGTICLEILLFAAFFMSYKHTKHLFWLGVLFHFSIIILFGLFSFFCSMCSGLIIYCVDPTTIVNFHTKWRILHKNILPRFS